MAAAKSMALLRAGVLGVASTPGSSTAASLPGCFVDSRAARQLPHQICLVTAGCATLSRCGCGDAKANHLIT